MHTKLLKKLHASGYEAFFVGGAVRDGLLGVEPKDFDIVTSAKPEGIERCFNDGYKLTTVNGSRFKVMLVNGIEIATYRKDIQTKLGDAKHCYPTYADTLEEDLQRRDLTINAMAFDPSTERFVDLFDGAGDLKKGIIRFIGDPEQRIMEDPCRILRACRFLAKLEGTFSTTTAETLTKKAHMLKYVKKERIRKEIMKVMTYDTPSLFFSALFCIGALEYVFPEMLYAVDHPHGKYHKETVWEHLMLAGDNIHKKFPLLRLAGFLHDIGKPLAYKYNNGESFIMHEFHGKSLCHKMLKRLKFTNKEVSYVTELVHSHMLQCRSLKPSSARRLQKKLADRRVDPRDFIRLKLADRKANTARGKNKPTPIKELLINAGVVAVEEEVPFTVKSLALTGGDIINITNTKPGPIVGIIHRYLLEYVLKEGPEHNTFMSLLHRIYF